MVPATAFHGLRAKPCGFSLSSESDKTEASPSGGPQTGQKAANTVSRLLPAWGRSRGLAVPGEALGKGEHRATALSTFLKGAFSWLGVRVIGTDCWVVSRALTNWFWSLVYLMFLWAGEGPGLPAGPFTVRVAVTCETVLSMQTHAQKAKMWVYWFSAPNF